MSSAGGNDQTSQLDFSGIGAWSEDAASQQRSGNQQSFDYALAASNTNGTSGTQTGAQQFQLFSLYERNAPAGGGSQ
ncbi:hypothetical protein N3K66_005368 [Trichothecium roseum]|uniref:Uncharacterized protein n=1 Tax=Trichothecium roseum TaxID=47278 RepID=A0ACC0UZK3_9HYPO|nr:hypothetical protein N3K66_005368 [Trichothecium roseum]